MPITINELKDRLQASLEGVDRSDSASLQAKIGEFMEYSIEQYDQLDEEAKAYIDNVFHVLQKAAKALADALPEGPEKRRTMRQLSLAGGGHFQAEHLIEILEGPPQHTHPIMPVAREAFAVLLQRTLDVLFDVTRHSHQGAANFAQMGLSYWAVDELIAAMRLAQCAFTNQSYSHIRTFSEIRDLIELFDKQPEWASLWVGGNDKEVWSELRPKAVRKKLGGPKEDPLYAFLCAHGSHGTFRGLQARSAQSVERGAGDTKRVRIWVGGSPFLNHIVWTNSLCVYAVLQLLVKCAGILARYLNEDEMTVALRDSGELVGEFFRTHYIAWAKDAGLTYEPVSEFLNAEPWKRA